LKQEANRKQKITNKNQTIHTKRDFKNNDLKEPNKMIHGFLMPFTRVPAQSKRREESCGLISSSQQEKKLKIRRRPQNMNNKVLILRKGRMSKVKRKKH
jgi:hypothetical protein